MSPINGPRPDFVVIDEIAEWRDRPMMWKPRRWKRVDASEVVPWRRRIGRSVAVVFAVVVFTGTVFGSVYGLAALLSRL